MKQGRREKSLSPFFYLAEQTPCTVGVVSVAEVPILTPSPSVPVVPSATPNSSVTEIPSAGDFAD
jgi:hypothetical protein